MFLGVCFRAAYVIVCLIYAVNCAINKIIIINIKSLLFAQKRVPFLLKVISGTFVVVAVLFLHCERTAND